MVSKVKSVLKAIPFIGPSLKRLARMRRNWKDGFNLYKTLVLNFRAFTFKQACGLPIYVFGKLKIYNVGKIIVEAEHHKGMIELGRNRDRFKASAGSAMLDNKGLIIFRGPIRFSVDFSIYNMTTGVVDLEAFTFFGNNSKIYCYSSIVIGKCCRLGGETQFFDSGFHFLRNSVTGDVRTIFGEVKIGDFCWVGNRSTIARGAVLPDRTVVASNSLVNKDFSDQVEPLLAGMPAKVISNNLVRVFNRDDENKLFSYFAENPTETVYPHYPPAENELDIVREEYYNRN